MGQGRPGRRHLPATARAALQRPGPGDESGGLRASQTGHQGAGGETGRQGHDSADAASRQSGRPLAAGTGPPPYLHLRPFRWLGRPAVDHQDRWRPGVQHGPAAHLGGTATGQRPDLGDRPDDSRHPGDLEDRERRQRLGTPGARTLRGRGDPFPRRQEAAGVGAMGAQGRLPDRWRFRQQRECRDCDPLPRIRRHLHGALPQYSA
ncbi:hypothetical protein FQZ97_999790 [compost metagenome]